MRRLLINSGILHHCAPVCNVLYILHQPSFSLRIMRDASSHLNSESKPAPYRSISKVVRGMTDCSWPAAVIRTRIRIAAVHRKSRQMMGFTSDRGPEVAQLAQAPMPRCSPAPINTATQCLYARASSLLSPSSSPAGFPDVRSSPSPELLCRSQRPPSASPQQRWRPPSMLPPPAWMRSSATMTSLTETELLAPCRGRTQNG